MKASREKKIAIALLTEKLKKISGKDVKFEDSPKVAKVKKLIEALEKVSGKKVILEAIPATAAVPGATAAPGTTSTAPATPTAAAQPTGQTAAPAADPGKAAAARVVAAMAVDPIIAQLAPSIKTAAANPAIKQLATEATINEEVITLASVLIGLAAVGVLSAISAAYSNVKENAALKAKLLTAIQRDFAKAGVQATPQQIEAELAKRLPNAKAQQAANIRVRPMQ